MLKNLKLAPKMMLSFGLVALLALFLGIFGYYGSVQNQQSIDEIGLVSLPKVENLLIIKERANAVRTIQRTLMDMDLDPKLREEQYGLIGIHRDAYQSAWKMYESLPRTEQEAQLWNQLKVAWENWRKANNTFFEMTKELEKLDLGDSAHLMAKINKFIGDHHALKGNVFQLISGDIQFEGGEDHNDCNFGKWVSTFHTNNPDLKQLLQIALEPHKKTHENVKQIKRLIASGNTDRALSIFNSKLTPNIQETIAKFHAIEQVAEEGDHLYFQMKDLSAHQVRLTADKTMVVLDKLVQLNTAKSNEEVETAHSLAESLEFGMLTAAAVAVVLAFVIAFLMTRTITKPIIKAANISKELSKGNLAVHIESTSKDESGMMLDSMKEMAENLRNMFSDINSGVATLSSSSTELSSVSSQLTSSADETTNRSTTVSSGAEELTTNMSSVSAAMEQSASNVGMVATAAEEMAATVLEIARNTTKAQEISDEAVEQSQRASTKINDLGNAANRIGKVTETITEISEQTNLLALNATIEAARAGEAGKGFAVVANEIKDLAKQTADATIDIKNQIDEMQQTTSGTITDIERNAQIIAEISDIIQTIATAVEEQSAATSEISENIAQASLGINEVNQNVASSTMAISEINKDISDINSSSQEVNTGSYSVNSSATELASLAQQLDSLVKQFKLN